GIGPPVDYGTRGGTGVIPVLAARHTVAPPATILATGHYTSLHFSLLRMRGRRHWRKN
ncbi:hypothetical protein ACLOJK_004835, partial [Asimina triloba]